MYNSGEGSIFIKKTKNPDELNEVVNAINHMRDGLIAHQNIQRNLVKELQNEKDYLEERVAERTAELQESLDEIKTLHGIIPICSYCKKIRNDHGAWEIIEAYISTHSDAQFSHGACPECYKKTSGRNGKVK
ncbi:hypothetical protein QUF70_20000 [Desulfobacterales bacterium HSG17]|nr:hypothetical protein [Desulfobacterales bacterium HSG17]